MKKDVMKLSCDGCHISLLHTDLLYIHDYGHEVRYCAECVEVYRQFVVTCQAEEQRRQRELDLWMLERRTHVPLALMPLDLPPKRSITLDQPTEPMRLG